MCRTKRTSKASCRRFLLPLKGDPVVRVRRQTGASGHRYAVSARIEADGRLLFITTERHGVALDGSDPQPLRIRVDALR